MASQYRFIEIEQLKKGDILAFFRAGGVYFHCGIYAGKGKVIHRAAEPGSGSRGALDTNSLFTMCGKECGKAEIRKDCVRLVAGSSSVYRIDTYDDIMQRTEEETLKWAEEQMGKKGYNLLFKNCQHFCSEAKYRIPFNMQLEEHLGLRTGNYTQINIANLPDLSFESDPPKYKFWKINYTTATSLPKRAKDLIFGTASRNTHEVHISTLEAPCKCYVGTFAESNDIEDIEYPKSSMIREDERKQGILNMCQTDMITNNNAVIRFDNDSKIECPNKMLLQYSRSCFDINREQILNKIKIFSSGKDYSVNENCNFDIGFSSLEKKIAIFIVIVILILVLFIFIYLYNKKTPLARRRNS